jgi:hypothetical protein
VRLCLPVEKALCLTRGSLSHTNKVCGTLVPYVSLIARVASGIVLPLLTRIGEIIQKSSSLLSVATPRPYGIRRKEKLDVWKLGQGERYFAHDRDSWPTVPGLAFEIHTERLEDQLAAEAKAASPFNFDQDDKENDVTNTRLDESSSILDAMSVMPASQYRRPSDDHYASHRTLSALDAFSHDVAFDPSPYGLGGGDGSNEPGKDTVDSDFVSETLKLLASGEQLPCTPSKEDGVDQPDSVVRLSLSTATDSVIGPSSPIVNEKVE